MSYNACDVAEFVIYYSNIIEKPLSNFKLQKLLYFIQGEFFRHGSECFSDEMEAWDYGPVVENVYKKYKVYSGGNIPGFIAKNPAEITDDDKAIIESVIDKYKDTPANQLVEITHNQSPWKKSFKTGVRNIISKDSIKDCFLENL